MAEAPSKADWVRLAGAVTTGESFSTVAVVVPAALVARPDVRAVFPWYPRVQHAGFLLTVPKRPHGVPKYTDVQVEVIDGNGGRVRLPDMTIDW